MWEDSGTPAGRGTLASLSGSLLVTGWANCGPSGQGLCNSGSLVPRQPVEATDDAFWDQFWADTATSVQDVFALVPAAEIRAVREESPSNLATLCYKVRAAQSLAATLPPSQPTAGEGRHIQDLPTPRSGQPCGFTQLSHFSLCGSPRWAEGPWQPPFMGESSGPQLSEHLL